eukprot:PRCOL_00006232-RA
MAVTMSLVERRWRAPAGGSAAARARADFSRARARRARPAQAAAARPRARPRPAAERGEGRADGVRLGIARASADDCCAPRIRRYPGAKAPAYLDGSMAGDFGFDPLRLGANSNLLPYYQEAELMNGRYACLACLGAILSEVAFPEFQWWEAGAQDYGFTIQQLLMVQVPLMAIFEAKRIEGWQKTGGVGVLTEFPFDPLNKYEGKESNYAEILNCRMAMIAFVGMCSAAANRHMGPLACAQAHIDAPFEVNAFTSDVGLELTTAAVVLSIAPFFVIAKQALGDGKEETFNPVPFDFQD